MRMIVKYPAVYTFEVHIGQFVTRKDIHTSKVTFHYAILPRYDACENNTVYPVATALLVGDITCW